MRGAHQNLTNSFSLGRIIPADAGSTNAYLHFWSANGDHPRRCGEHIPDDDTHLYHPGIIPADAGSTHPLTKADGHVAGSSPQMRGARLGVVAPLIGSGIIPADAGSTEAGDVVMWRGGDHPRRCGEHRPPNSHKTRFKGSSPQMRGARSGSVGRVPLVRIIPADAGSTFRFLSG